MDMDRDMKGVKSARTISHVKSSYQQAPRTVTCPRTASAEAARRDR